MQKTKLDIINGQIDDAKGDLKRYLPREMNWHLRAKTAACELVPSLENNASALKEYVEGVLNAPVELRQMWADIRPHVNLPKGKIEAFDRQLALDEVLGETVTGELICKVATKFLLDHDVKLKTNGRSDYPDLYLSTQDYSALPRFRRIGDGAKEEYGATIKGDNRPD